MTVDFPALFGPTRTVIEPRETLKSRRALNLRKWMEVSATLVWPTGPGTANCLTLPRSVISVASFSWRIWR